MDDGKGMARPAGTTGKFNRNGLVVDFSSFASGNGHSRVCLQLRLLRVVMLCWNAGTCPSKV